VTASATSTTLRLERRASSRNISNARFSSIECRSIKMPLARSVIAILDVEDEAFIRDAAKRGIFAYITLGRDASALQSSLDVVLSRFAEYQGLEGAFARRAITERAKGILMERHSIDEKRAFEMLRDEARRSNRKVVDVAEAVAMSVNLLPRSPSD
jgi:response regulator NasT